MKHAAKVRRNFEHPLTLETTRLRYNPENGSVSRPERAGQDVGPHIFCIEKDVETCRAVWKSAQADLLAEGFVIVSTERY